MLQPTEQPGQGHESFHIKLHMLKIMCWKRYLNLNVQYNLEKEAESWIE